MSTVPPISPEPARASWLSRAGGGSGGRSADIWPGGRGVATAVAGQASAGGTISRIPPHSFEAEESLLGAMLLSRDAIAVAVEDVGGDDFYRPSHAHIFAAITSLYGRGEPADAVTVAEEMRRLGTLDPSGGISTLVSLQANTPAISSVSRYARIVQENAQLRRLIGTAYEIAEMGYQLPTDVVAALDRAEAMIFDVAQRRSSDSTRALKDLLTESLEHLEYLANRDETITGVATGYNDLDMELFGLQPSNLIVVGARPSMGKALALDTPIPTPDGWTTMGAIQVDDTVFDDYGQPCRVTYVSPVQRDRQCYRVEFDDGSTIVADADHQWFAYDLPAWRSAGERYRKLSCPPLNPKYASDQSYRWKHPRVVTTQQMLDEGLTTSDNGRPNWYIALAGVLDLPEQDLPIDPYVLGCWLGDGHSAGSQMTIGDQDLPHFQNEFALAGYPLIHRYKLEYATVPIAGKNQWQGYAGPFRVLTRELQKAGLLRGNKKHIPAVYLRAASKQRLALLQGIMDTDGHANAQGGAELCLANRALCEQVRELVCSLGHKPGQLKHKTINLPDGRICSAWRFTWTPLDNVFRMERKARVPANSRPHRRFGRSARRCIRTISPIDSVPVRCITVDSTNHLYLAGESMIPTHNTSFVLGMAAHAARSGVPVLFFSLEMSHLELAQRVLCAEARVDANRLRNGKLADSDWPKISGAIGRVGTAPLYIDDNPNVTVMDIRAKARRMKSAEGGLGLVIVDYLQLMSGRSSAENRQVEISEISRGLKILARELSIPVVAASQLSRGLEARADKRPMLADLRESGAIEQDADVVMFIYRDEIYNNESSDRGTAEILIAKHRNGPTGVARLSFISNYARFGDLARM